MTVPVWRFGQAISTSAHQHERSFGPLRPARPEGGSVLCDGTPADSPGTHTARSRAISWPGVGGRGQDLAGPGVGRLNLCSEGLQRDLLDRLSQHPLGPHLLEVRGRADAPSRQSEVDLDDQKQLAAEAPLVVAEGELAGGERGGFVRDRTHRFPGRRNALKVLYDDVEIASVRAAAELAGLTPTGFVAAAGLTLAGSGIPPASSADRALLAELLQGRTALRRYGVNPSTRLSLP